MRSGRRLAIGGVWLTSEEVGPAVLPLALNHGAGVVWRAVHGWRPLAAVQPVDEAEELVACDRVANHDQWPPREALLGLGGGELTQHAALELELWQLWGGAALQAAAPARAGRRRRRAPGYRIVGHQPP